MSILPRVWTLIYYPWSQLFFPGVPTPDPLVDDTLNYSVANEIADNEVKLGAFSNSIFIPPIMESRHNMQSDWPDKF